MKLNRSEFIYPWSDDKYAVCSNAYSIAPISAMLPNKCNTEDTK